MPKDYQPVQLTPTELMRMLKSSKGYDPIPPDQYLTYQDARYPPPIRLWAWLLSKTIRSGHRKSRCATDNAGRPLMLADAARDLGMNSGTASRGWAELERERRVEKVDGKYLAIAGDVELAPGEVMQIPERKPKPMFADYIMRQIEKLPAEKQAALLTRAKDLESTTKRLQADAMAAVRAAVDDREQELFSEFGIALQSKPPRREESEFVKTLADYVHNRLDIVYTESCTQSASLLKSLEVNTESYPPPPTPSSEQETAMRMPTTAVNPPKTLMPELPLTLEALRQRFTTSTIETAVRLFEASVTALQSLDARRIEVSDETLAKAIIASNSEVPSQRSVGLYFRNVPAIMQTWAQAGIPMKRPPVPERSKDFVSDVIQAAERRFAGD